MGGAVGKRLEGDDAKKIYFVMAARLQTILRSTDGERRQRGSGGGGRGDGGDDRSEAQRSRREFAYLDGRPPSLAARAQLVLELDGVAHTCSTCAPSGRTWQCKRRSNALEKVRRKRNASIMPPRDEPGVAARARIDVAAI